VLIIFILILLLCSGYKKERRWHFNSIEACCVQSDGIRINFDTDDNALCLQFCVTVQEETSVTLGVYPYDMNQQDALFTFNLFQ